MRQTESQSVDPGSEPLVSANTRELGPDPRVPGLLRVTKWLMPNDLVRCALGVVRVKAWLESERDRIQRAPGRRAAVVRFRGWVALYVD